MAATGPLRSGVPVSLVLRAQFRDIEPGAELYLALLPIDGDQGVLNGTKLSVGNPVRFDYCANFRPGSDRTFNIAATNYPLTATLRLGTIFSAFGVREEQLGDQKDLEVELGIGFVAAFGRGGNGVTDGVIDFKPVVGNDYYDAVLAVPLLVRQRGTQRCVTFDSDRLNTLRLPFDPGVDRPPDKPRVAETPDLTTGPVRVVSIEPAGTELVLGRQNTLRLHVDYEGLPENAEVYVMLLAVRGDTIIRSDGRLLTASDGSKFGMSFTTCELELKTGRFQIPEQNRPVLAEFPYIEAIEGAAVAPALAGGSGRASGMVRLTPPPFAVYYDGVEFQPLVVWRADDGRLCAKRDSQIMTGRVVPVAGRRFR